MDPVYYWTLGKRVGWLRTTAVAAGMPDAAAARKPAVVAWLMANAHDRMAQLRDAEGVAMGQALTEMYRAR